MNIKFLIFSLLIISIFFTNNAISKSMKSNYLIIKINYIIK